MCAAYLASDNEDDDDPRIAGRMKMAATPKKKDSLTKAPPPPKPSPSSFEKETILNSYDMDITDDVSKEIPSVIKSVTERNNDEKLMVLIPLQSGVTENEHYRIKVQGDKIILKYQAPKILHQVEEFWSKEDFTAAAINEREMIISKELARLCEAMSDTIWYIGYIVLPKPSWDNKIHYNLLIKSSKDGGAMLVVEVLVKCGFADEGKVAPSVKTVD